MKDGRELLSEKSTKHLIVMHLSTILNQRISGLGDVGASAQNPACRGRALKIAPNRHSAELPPTLKKTPLPEIFSATRDNFVLSSASRYGISALFSLAGRHHRRVKETTRFRKDMSGGLNALFWIRQRGGRRCTGAP
jgi:hypothetical protein